MITSRDIMDLKTGLGGGLLHVHLFKYPNSLDDRYDQDKHMRDCYEWCLSNLGARNELWTTGGITIYSFRIIFTNKEDAVAFKLTFGL